MNTTDLFFYPMYQNTASLCQRLVSSICRVVEINYSCIGLDEGYWFMLFSINKKISECNAIKKTWRMYTYPGCGKNDKQNPDACMT